MQAYRERGNIRSWNTSAISALNPSTSPTRHTLSTAWYYLLLHQLYMHPCQHTSGCRFDHVGVGYARTPFLHSARSGNNSKPKHLLHLRTTRYMLWRPLVHRIYCSHDAHRAGHMASDCKGQAKEKGNETDTKEALRKPFQFLYISVLREYLDRDLKPAPVCPQYPLFVHIYIPITDVGNRRRSFYSNTTRSVQSMILCLCVSLWAMIFYPTFQHSRLGTAYPQDDHGGLTFCVQGKCDRYASTPLQKIAANIRRIFNQRRRGEHVPRYALLATNAITHSPREA